MPPRYAYWTILIDQKPTAFRAREREELLPTLHQLKRKNADVVMKWFARGRLWESPEEATAAQRAPKAPLEKRGRDWRPGGKHRDPRDRFKKRSSPQAARPESPPGRPTPGGRPPPRPRDHKLASGPPRSGRPWGNKQGSAPPRAAKPWGSKPSGPPRSSGSSDRRDHPRGQPARKPWSGAPQAETRTRKPEMPSSPPATEKIVTKPKPPENG